MSYENFKKCTNTVFDGDVWDIECKLGLWGVSCADKEQAQDEALYYFRQYYQDGEYKKLLAGGKS